MVFKDPAKLLDLSANHGLQADHAFLVEERIERFASLAVEMMVGRPSD